MYLRRTWKGFSIYIYIYMKEVGNCIQQFSALSISIHWKYHLDFYVSWMNNKKTHLNGTKNTSNDIFLLKTLINVLQSHDQTTLNPSSTYWSHMIKQSSGTFSIWAKTIQFVNCTQNTIWAPLTQIEMMVCDKCKLKDGVCELQPQTQIGSKFKTIS